MSKIIITINHDHCVDDPCDMDGWKVYSFGRRHHNYTDPSTFEDDRDFSRKLAEGLAFPLSYYEHGQCMWSLSGEGPQCRWDSVNLAGFLVWESADDDLGPKTYEDRQKDARAFIEHYTQWCNGETFFYDVSRVTDCGECGNEKHVEDLDACGGFIGHEHLFETLRESVDIDPDETVEFRGEADYLADYWKTLVG